MLKGNSSEIMHLSFGLRLHSHIYIVIKKHPLHILHDITFPHDSEFMFPSKKYKENVIKCQLCGWSKIM